MTTRRHVLAAVLVAGVLLAGCGGDDGDDEATDGSSSTTVTTAAADATTGSEAPTTTADDATPSTEGDASTTSTGSAPADADLPGEPIDIYPYEGAVLAVVGVDASDTLNVRAGPGTDAEVVVELDPLADGFTATGRNRTLDDGSFWAEVIADGRTGWANSAYLAQLGAASDATADVTPPVEEPDTESAALAIARQLFPAAEGPAPTITVVARASATDVTVDVIGLGDDAQKGSRLHVTGVGPEVAVEARALCVRGVTDDGLCL